ncbi:hypothetical protein [Filibacter tadaridae]|nr:hypothetical protein [Filibacter tadaridae]
MKKVLVMAIIAALFTLTACSTGNGANEEGTKEKKDGKEGALEVDKVLLSVEVTIPSTFMEGEDIDTIIAEAKENSIKNVTKNEDGSVTYEMSKAKHKEMMKEMKTNVTTYVDELISDEELPSIKDVKSNGSFSEFTVVVDKMLAQGKSLASLSIQMRWRKWYNRLCFIS